MQIHGVENRKQRDELIGSFCNEIAERGSSAPDAAFFVSLSALSNDVGPLAYWRSSLYAKKLELILVLSTALCYIYIC
jgi:hypothetical protein